MSEGPFYHWAAYDLANVLRARAPFIRDGVYYEPVVPKRSLREDGRVIPGRTESSYGTGIIGSNDMTDGMGLVHEGLVRQVDLTNEKYPMYDYSDYYDLGKVPDDDYAYIYSPQENRVVLVGKIQDKETKIDYNRMVPANMLSFAGTQPLSKMGGKGRTSLTAARAFADLNLHFYFTKSTCFTPLGLGTVNVINSNGLQQRCYPLYAPNIREYATELGDLRDEEIFIDPKLKVVMMEEQYGYDKVNDRIYMRHAPTIILPTILDTYRNVDKHGLRHSADILDAVDRPVSAWESYRRALSAYQQELDLHQQIQQENVDRKTGMEERERRRKSLEAIVVAA